MPPPPSRPPAAVNSARGFSRGAGLMFSGLRMWFTSPGLMLLGLLPAALTGAAYLLVVWFAGAAAWRLSGNLAEKLVGSSGGIADVVRVIIAVAVIVGLGFFLVRTFVSVTLWLGRPIYARMSAAIDARLGSARAPVEVAAPPLLGLPRLAMSLVRDGFRGVGAFVLGLIPAIGPFVAALAGGKSLARALAEPALDRKGIVGQSRDDALHEHRAMFTGFGAMASLLALIPFAAVIVMPASVAGATLLARAVAGEATRRP